MYFYELTNVGRRTSTKAPATSDEYIGPTSQCNASALQQQRRPCPVLIGGLIGRSCPVAGFPWSGMSGKRQRLGSIAFYKSNAIDIHTNLTKYPLILDTQSLFGVGIPMKILPRCEKWFRPIKIFKNWSEKTSTVHTKLIAPTQWIYTNPI